MRNTSEASLILRAPSSAVNGESELALSEAFFHSEHNSVPSVKACGQTIRYDGWPRVHAVSLPSAERTHITIVKVLCVKCSRHPVGEDVFLLSFFEMATMNLCFYLLSSENHKASCFWDATLSGERRHENVFIGRHACCFFLAESRSNLMQRYK